MGMIDIAFLFVDRDGILQLLLVAVVGVNALFIELVRVTL